MSKTREALRRAQQLCKWIAETPHSRGSINGLAAQVQHEIEAALAEPEQEPVMIYRGRHTIDCGEFGSHDMEMLKLIPAGTKLYTSPHPREWQEDIACDRAFINGLRVGWNLREAGREDRYQSLINGTREEISAALRAKNGG